MDQGQLPRRDEDGSALGIVWRRVRRRNVPGNTFDPTTAAGKRWLDQLANKLVTTGTHPARVEQRADEPGRRRPCDPAGRRSDRQGLAGRLQDSRHRLDADELAAGAGPLDPAERHAARGDGYPRNFDLVPMLDAAIESFKEMAEFGGTLGIKVTIENHWGLAADPMNIRIILDAVNHPYCEATPTSATGNTSTCCSTASRRWRRTAADVAGKWDRWGDRNDVQRSVRTMLAGGFEGRLLARVRKRAR